MAWFLIKYQDPESEQPSIVEKVVEFHDSPGDATSYPVSALFWAEDYAYTMADKGFHTVRQISERDAARFERRSQ